MRPHDVLIAASALVAAGCALPTPYAPRAEIPTVNLFTKFDAAESQRLAQPGANSVQGSAFMRQQGGGVVTCAGAEVSLVPATAYANERMATIFGVVSDGTLVSRRFMRFYPDEPQYHADTRITKCDAQGRFEFSAVPDGRFFISTTVEWTAGRSSQGGYIMQPAVLSGGKPHAIVISR